MKGYFDGCIDPNEPIDQPVTEYPFNIWDDFAEGLNTFGYFECEESDEIHNYEEFKAVLLFLFDHFKKVNPKLNIELDEESLNIDFIMPEYDELDALVDASQNLSYNGKPIIVYSES